MTAKSHYEVLGVPQTALGEDIKKAFLLRSRMFHPDRFSADTQKREWDLANEMLKDLNAAYDTLKDPASRAAYDRSLTQSFEEEPLREPVRPSVNPGKFNIGKAQFSAIPADVQEAIGTMIAEGTNLSQFVIRTGNPALRFGAMAAAAAWYPALFTLLQDFSWAGTPWKILLAVSVFAAVCAADLAAGLIAWVKSPTKCQFIVSKLYFIEISLDDVRWWPLWSAASIDTEHKGTAENYRGTECKISFENGDTITVHLPDPATCSRLILTAKTFNEVAVGCQESGDGEYLKTFNYFDGIEPSEPPAKATRFYIIAAVVGLVLFLAAAAMNAAHFP